MTNLLIYFLLLCSFRIFPMIESTLKPGRDDEKHSPPSAKRVLHSDRNEMDEDEFDPTRDLRKYQILFTTKRKEHWRAIEQIQKMEKEKRDRVVSSMIDGMHEGFKDAKFLLERSDFMPGAVFPDEQHEELREIVAKTLENAAFFADLALHFPNTIAKLYKRDQNLRTIFDWAVVFCNRTKFYDEKTTKLMHLLGQELGLVGRDANYLNPYSSGNTAETPESLAASLEALEKLRLAKIEKEKKAKREEKRKKQRGPRLQGGRSEL